ncbi:FG-GAP-like repeat-containing protein, partial [Okeania sp. KiyG1]|uniref:FG-GAP-like repeat-containing protein n=1 Tax=Okeania sp. KiyG1 TaxID=2720165 RepID=UPI00192226ED
WFNDGSGKFTDSGQSLGRSQGRGVSLVDLDGDGDLDAFVANWSNQPNKIWLNDGSGKFTDSGQALGNSSSQDVSVADVDGDGDLDAFVANQGKPNKVWLNDGSGKFTNSGQSLGNSKSLSVSLADVDGDGDLDAFVANYNQPNKVWFNDGSGKFTNSGQSLGNSASWDVSLADLDGDGDLDAFIPNDANQPNKVWFNDGSGKFTDSGQSLGRFYSHGSSLADVDGDGDLDAFVANRNKQPNKVWLNDGSGKFTDSGQSLGNVTSLGVTLGDVDGDGDFDAFVANYNQPNKVWLNNLDQYIKTCENTAPNNLVINGSFETPKTPKEEDYVFVTPYGSYPKLVPPVKGLDNWELVEGPGIIVYNDNLFVYDGYKYFQAYDGSQLVQLDSDNATTKISQKIATQPGDIYKLTFGFAGSGKSTTEHDKLNVNWGSELVEALDKLDSDTEWEVKTYNLQAKSTETVLSFDNLNETANGYGANLDGISVNLCQ